MKENTKLSIPKYARNLKKMKRALLKKKMLKRGRLNTYKENTNKTETVTCLPDICTLKNF